MEYILCFIVACLVFVIMVGVYLYYATPCEGCMSGMHEEESMVDSEPINSNQDYDAPFDFSKYVLKSHHTIVESTQPDITINEHLNMFDLYNGSFDFSKYVLI